MTNINKYKQIRELGKQIRGVTYKKSEISERPKDGYIPLLRANNIDNREINYDKLVYIKRGSVKEEQLLRNSDVLIATSSGSKKLVGKSAQFYINNYEMVTFGAFCKVVRPYHININPKYLACFFQTEIYRRNINKVVNGANINNLRNEHIDEQKLMFPNIESQNKIVDVIESAEAILIKRQQQIDALSTLKQSIFLDMFGDSITNPNNYQVNILDEIAIVRSSKRVFVKELVEDGIPFYRGNEIGLLAEDKEPESDLYISNEHYEKLKKLGGIPAMGDLLLPSICPDGRIYRVNHNEPFYIKDGRVLWISFSRNKDVNSTYIQYALKDKFLRDYSNIASGTTFAELKIFSLKKVEIMIPSMVSQNKFEKIITQIDKQRTTLENSLDKINLLYDSLLHKAFNGELFKENINV